MLKTVQKNSPPSDFQIPNSPRTSLDPRIGENGWNGTITTTMEWITKGGRGEKERKKRV